MGLNLLVSRPFDQVLILVEYAALPMIFNNALGIALAGYIVLDMIQRQREPRKQDDTKP